MRNSVQATRYLAQDTLLWAMWDQIQTMKEAFGRSRRQCPDGAGLIVEAERQFARVEKLFNHKPGSFGRDADALRKKQK